MNHKRLCIHRKLDVRGTLRQTTVKGSSKSRKLARGQLVIIHVPADAKSITGKREDHLLEVGMEAILISGFPRLRRLDLEKL